MGWNLQLKAAIAVESKMIPSSEFLPNKELDKFTYFTIWFDFFGFQR